MNLSRALRTALGPLLLAGAPLLSPLGILPMKDTTPPVEYPDYKVWGDLLAKHYDPAKGMNYRALKAQDKATLDALRQKLATVDPKTLSHNEQLAYWINLYNVSVVAVVVDGYPTESIRDLSTDPIIKLNVFKKPKVLAFGGPMSLNDVENDKIREGFKDPRIHFAINCAAKSCPPIRPEPYAGARINEQLDDQARRFLNGPKGVRVEKDGAGVKLHVSKILDWFADDFKKWGGGQVPFLKRFLTPDKVQPIEAAKGDVDLKFDDYDWKLNDSAK
jgi:hypothetical protein